MTRVGDKGEHATWAHSYDAHSTLHLHASEPARPQPNISSVSARVGTRPTQLTSAMSTRTVPYQLPPSHLSKPIIVCGIVMALSASRRFSAFHGLLLSQSPTLANVAQWLQTGIFWFLYGAHAIESAVFAKKLKDHGVSMLSAAWWKWMVECFVGGKFCFEHFEGMVKSKQ
ncbi:hypothetical protein PMIN02_011940 [Paraphaeosphaeria minitans]